MDTADSDLLEVSELRLGRSAMALEHLLSAARKHFATDIAVVMELAGSEDVVRAVEGDAGSFRMEQGSRLPSRDTIFEGIVAGLLPKIVTDAASDSHVRDLWMSHTAGVGSYVAVPLQSSSGGVLGVLCCLNHAPDSGLQDRDLNFLNLIAQLIADQIELQDLELATVHLQVRATGISAFMTALEVRDGYTSSHSEEVVLLSSAVARKLGLSEEEIAEVEQVALLHDVGKIGIRDSVLKKRGPLDESEWQEMEQHPVIGARMVASIEELQHLAPAIRAEHERWDGMGYPDGLSGKQIPLASRIVFACDSYHAMISDRPYRSAIHEREAVAAIKVGSGSQFCPETVEALVAVLEDTPILVWSLDDTVGDDLVLPEGDGDRRLGRAGR